MAEPDANKRPFEDFAHTFSSSEHQLDDQPNLLRWPMGLASRHFATAMKTCHAIG